MQRELMENPNLHATPFNIKIESDCVDIKGYQSYKVTKNSILYTGGDLSQEKVSIFDSTILPNMKDKSFLDLGTALGFFSIKAKLNGAKLVTAVDLDNVYLTALNNVNTKFNFGINIINDNVQNIKTPHDIVLAYALIHWIYSATTSWKNLDTIIKWLHSITNEMLILEWISPEDSAIVGFGHTSDGVDNYTTENFEQAINKYFSKINVLGGTNQRKIYGLYI